MGFWNTKNFKIKKIAILKLFIFDFWKLDLRFRWNLSCRLFRLRLVQISFVSEMYGLEDVQTSFHTEFENNNNLKFQNLKLQIFEDWKSEIPRKLGEKNKKLFSSQKWDSCEKLQVHSR